MLANQYIIAKLNNIETGAVLEEFWNRGLITAQGPWSQNYLVQKGLLRQESIDYANVLKKNEDYQETLTELNMREHDLARDIIYDAQEDYKKGSTREELMQKYQIGQYNVDDLISAFNEEDEHERYKLLDEWSLSFMGLDDNWHCFDTLTACLFEEYTVSATLSE